jgi:hypothetical protein
MNCPTCAAHLRSADEYERRAEINAEIATAAQECLKEAVRQAENAPELYLPETVARWRKAAGMPNAQVERRAPSTFAPTPGSTTEEGKA